MQILNEISHEANFADATAASRSLAYAQAFTNRFREVENQPAAIREAAMLKLQASVVFQPWMAGDLFVGRVLYPCIVISPEPGGLGYAFDIDGAKFAAQSLATPQEAESWQQLIDYWAKRTTAAKVRAAYPESVAKLLPSDNWTGESGVAFPLYRIAGSMLDFGKLLQLGIDGLASEVKGMPADETGFREGCLDTLETFQEVIDRYASTPGLEPTIVATLRAIRHLPPASLREAIQLLWLYALFAGTWSYGRLDDTLGSFLAADLDAGRLSEAEALDLLCGLWRLMHGYSNQYNNRVIIGGRGRRNTASADRFAKLAIEATRRVRLNQPQLSLRFHEGMDPELWERSLDAIGEGCTFPMLYNDDVNIPAVASAFNVDTETATEYLPFGCGEFVLGSFGLGSPNGVINLLKALEVALHGGVDPLTGQCLVDGIPAANQIANFETLWLQYTRVVEAFTTALAWQEKIEYDVTGREAGLLPVSMLLGDCLQRGKPALAGGLRHLGGTIETYGNTNAADSLHVINELVFKSGELSLEAFVTALDANFEGHEALRRRCLAIAKYGNDEATADAMAQRVHNHICHTARNCAAEVGLDSYLVVIINNWANTILGERTGASAEGRLAGQPMANGNNPAPGADISGVTAFLNSLTRLDPSIHAGAVQNMKFGKEWFGQMRPKIDALLRTYFANGGTQAMITVVSRDDLESAMREPENWGHLMVRVGGFSIRFIDLPREAQLEVLARTLH